MDYLKSLSRPALLVTLGILVLVLALSKNFELGPLKYTSESSSGSRTGLLALGVILIAAGGVTHLRGRAPTVIGKDDDTNAASVDEVLKTLDELASFPDWIEEASRVSILARTGINILNSYERVLGDLCARGAEIRVLFVHPESTAAQLLYGVQTSAYERNREAAVSQLRKLKQTIGPRLSVKTTTIVPAFSIVHVESASRDNEMRIQLNFMYSRIGRDRPVLVVRESDRWYEAFVAEFDATWYDGAEF